MTDLLDIVNVIHGINYNLSNLILDYQLMKNGIHVLSNMIIKSQLFYIKSEGCYYLILQGRVSTNDAPMTIHSFFLLQKGLEMVFMFTFTLMSIHIK